MLVRSYLGGYVDSSSSCYLVDVTVHNTGNIWIQNNAPIKQAYCTKRRYASPSHTIVCPKPELASKQK